MFWELPNLVVVRPILAFAFFTRSALFRFCALLVHALAFALFCALLRTFACFCVRPHLERPRLGTAECFLYGMWHGYKKVKRGLKSPHRLLASLQHPEVINQARLSPARGCQVAMHMVRIQVQQFRTLIQQCRPSTPSCWTWEKRAECSTGPRAT